MTGIVRTVNGQGPDNTGNVPVSVGGGGAVFSVVGQTGAVSGLQILADSDVAAALASKYRFVAGRYYTAPCVNSVGGLTMTNDLIVATPILVPSACTLTGLLTRVDIAGNAGAVCRLGIWSSNADGDPSAMVLDAGTVTADATGNKTLTISKALTAGLYWFSAVIQSNGGTAVKLYGLYGISPFVGRTGADANVTASMGYSLGSAAGALPSTPPSTPSAVQGAPSIWVKV